MGDEHGPTIRRRTQGSARQRRVQIRAVRRALRALPDGVAIIAPRPLAVRMLTARGAS